MASFNFNKAILGGRLVADPELKTTQSGIPVISFAIAVNRRFGNKESGETTADFIDCTAWRQQAEFINRFFRKGSSICVVGSLQKRKWQDQNGQNRYSTEVVVDEVNFVDSKSEGPAASQSAGQYGQASYVPDNYGAPSFNSQNAQSPKFEEIADDDELPF